MKTPGTTGLRSRAQAQAKKPSEVLQLVAFTVGEGQYALDIMRIKEIINPVRVTPVPKAPPFIEGVIELRGAILPIIDLRKRFDLPATTIGRATKFVIASIDVQERRMIVGLVVDAVTEPLRVPIDQVRAAPALAQGDAAYFSGVVHHKDSIYMILAIDAILSSKEKISLARLDGGGP